MTFDSGIYWIIEGAWVGFLAYWVVKAFGVKRVARRQGVASRLIQIAGIGAAFILLFNSNIHWGVLASRFVPAGRGWPEAGAALTCAGVAIAIWARAILGGNWSGTVTVKEDHTLVRTGPYAVVRHPIYSGLLLAVAGTALAVGEIRGILALAIASAALVNKSHLEERFMAEEFGREYEDYRRRTCALIPFVF